MRHFVFLLFLFVTGLLSAQFNRSYLNMTQTSWHAFGYYVHLDEQETIVLTSLGVQNNLELITQEMNDLGDVLSIRKNEYNIPVNNGNTQDPLSIVGVCDREGSRYYVIQDYIQGENQKYRLIWLKTDAMTGNLQSIDYSPGMFLSNYVEAKLIENEFVTYTLTEDKRLYRIAMHLDAGNLTQELVGQLSSVPSFGIVSGIFVSQGRRGGAITMLNGKETFFGLGADEGYVRDSPNIYSSFSVPFDLKSPNGTLNLSWVNQNLCINLGTRIALYNSTGNLIDEYTLDMDAGIVAKSIYYSNGFYYFIAEGSTDVKVIKMDNAFNFIEEWSSESNLRSIVKTFDKDNKHLLLGTQFRKTEIDIAESQETTETSSITPYIELFEEEPKLKREEYATEFEPSNSLLKVNIGLGLNFIVGTENVTAGSLYDGKSVTFNLREYYVGEEEGGYLVSNCDVAGYSGSPNLLSGPSMPQSLYDEVQEAKYNRSYYVTSEMIANHLNTLSVNPANYIPPHGIREWPGNGDVELGQAEQIAPFVDVNNNGIYEPMEGDYPLIYGDECIFNISHNLTGEGALEIQTFTYSFSCDTSDIFDDVIFRKIDMISRGAAFDSLYFGTIDDGDIGRVDDDYMGTNVDLGMTYFYNGLINLEEDPNLSFEDKLPAMGTLFLRGFKQEENGQDNSLGSGTNQSPNGFGYGDGIPDNEYKGMEASTFFPNTIALNSSILKNAFKGLSADGDSIYFTSYDDPNQHYKTKYVFFNNEDSYNAALNGNPPPFPWSEFNTNGNSEKNIPGDRRLCNSFGKGRLNLNDTVSLAYAYIFARDTIPTESITSPVNVLFDKGWKIRNALLNNEGPCGFGYDIFPVLAKEEYQLEEDILVYPNPTQEIVIMEGMTSLGTVEFYNLSGRLVQSVQDYQNGDMIDVSNLTGGIYFIIIETENQKKTKKMVKL